MKKKLGTGLKWFFSGLGLLCLVLLVLDLTLGSIAKWGIEQVGSRLLGVRVRVGSVSVSPLMGRATLRELRIGNPRGYTAPSLLEVGRIEARFEPASLWKQRPLRVSSLQIESPRVHVEGTLSQNNLIQVQGNLKRNLGAEGCKPETKVSIGWLQMRDSQGSFLLPGAREPLVIHPADVELKTLGARNGYATGVIASRVFERMASNTLKEVAVRAALQGLQRLLQ